MCMCTGMCVPIIYDICSKLQGVSYVMTISKYLYACSAQICISFIYCCHIFHVLLFLLICFVDAVLFVKKSLFLTNTLSASSFVAPTHSFS